MSILAANDGELIGPFEKPGIDAEFARILHRLRKYSAASVVVRALALLRELPTEPTEALRVVPWHILLIVKWALQDPLLRYRGGPTIDPREFDAIRQELWQLADGRRSDGTRPNSIFLMLRALMYPQLEFQRQPGLGFLRWPALYARLPQANRSRRQFHDAIGVEPNVFIDVAFSLFSITLNGRLQFNLEELAPLRRLYGTNFDKVCSLFIRDLPDLRLEMRKESALKIAGKSELYEFPYLKRYPPLLNFKWVVS